MAGKLTHLNALQRRLATLKARELAEPVAEKLLELIDEGFQKDAAPDGKRWPAHKGTGDIHPLLENTGAMREGYDAKVSDDSVTVTNSQPYANYATKNRAVVPKDGLPAKWKSELDKTAADALAEKLKP